MEKDELEKKKRKLFDSIVHGLRSRGWDRIDAECEALDRIEKHRSRINKEGSDNV